jgi:hypothetical protein
MAITNLKTVSPSQGGSGGTLKTVLIIGSIIGIGYLAYKHWYKPRFLDKVQDNAQNNVQR